MRVSSGVPSLPILPEDTHLKQPSVFSAPAQCGVCRGAGIQSFATKIQELRGQGWENKHMSIQITWRPRLGHKGPEKPCVSGAEQLWEKLSLFWQWHSPPSCFCVGSEKQMEDAERDAISLTNGLPIHQALGSFTDHQCPHQLWSPDTSNSSLLFPGSRTAVLYNPKSANHVGCLETWFWANSGQVDQGRNDLQEI